MNFTFGGGGGETYPSSFNGSEAFVRFFGCPLQYKARVLGVKNLLVHLLAQLAEFDRNDRKWIPSCNHSDRIWAPHRLAVGHLVVLLCGQL